MPQQFIKNSLGQYESERLPVGWPWRFLSGSFLIFLAAVLGYLGLLYGYEPFLSSRIEKQDQAINQLAGTISGEDQKKFALAYSKIINLKNLLENHYRASQVFPFLEKITNQKVYYSRMNLKVPEHSLELEGVADSYDVLSEQLEAYNQSDSVERYILNQSQLTNDGVLFKLVLQLKDKFLK